MVISNSLFRGNLFFLFRENGTEIPFEINNGKIHTDYNLTEEEKTYLNLKFNPQNK